LIEQVFVPAVIAVSTALGFALATRRFGWPAGGVIAASGKVLECVGLAVVFCLLNVVVGTALVLSARVVSGRFVSLYLGADQTLLVASALQALLIQWWRESSRRGR
jgi:hypothetical protein